MRRRSNRGGRVQDTTAGQILDHFVSSYEWSIPTRLRILGFEFLEQTPGEFNGRQHLAWSVLKPLTQVHAGPELLEDFVKLDSAPDMVILSYARRWGPLWLCPLHDLPWRHDPTCEPAECDWDMEDEEEGKQVNEDEEDEERFEDGGIDSVRVDEGQTWYDEPLAGWRALSGQVRATIRLARRLHDGQPGFNADWDALPFLPDLIRRTLAPIPPDPLASIEDRLSWSELEQLEDLPERRRR